jgi:uncharacterized protein (DUF2384 family)
MASDSAGAIERLGQADAERPIPQQIALPGIRRSRSNLGLYPCVWRAHADTVSEKGALDMATAFAGEAAHIQQIGHLTVPDIARATGANETTVRAWLRDDRSPSGIRAERLVELSSIVERLVRVMQATYVPVWMRKPIPLLDDDKPLDVIAAGDYRRVSRVVAGLEAPGAV